MVDIKYSNAITEVLHYLKGIKQDDINKIPKNLLIFLEQYASKNYTCKFDYTKPLKELDLLDETRGIIGMICLNYWCVTEEQKKNYFNKLSENEKKYQQELRKMYNPDNLFKNKNVIEFEKLNKPVEMSMIQYKETIFSKIKKFIKEWFKK